MDQSYLMRMFHQHWQRGYSLTRHVSSRNIVVAGVAVLVVDRAVVVYEIDEVGKNKDFQDVDFDAKRLKKNSRSMKG